jgi:transcriptional regulator with XRE-family HTH domain
LEQQLIAMRERRGLSQHELANRAGVKQPQIARIESGRAKNITLRTLAKISSALGATPQIHFHKRTSADRDWTAAGASSANPPKRRKVPRAERA